jgi:hypothetical protein
MPVVVIIVCVLLGLNVMYLYSLAIAGQYSDGSSPGGNAFNALFNVGLFVWLCTLDPITPVVVVMLMLLTYALVWNMYRVATNTYSSDAPPWASALTGTIALAMLIWFLATYL